MPFLEPLAFTPIFRRLIWGGRKLGTVLGKSIDVGDDYAESWEIADYKDAVSVIRLGRLAGMTLRDLVLERPVELFGRAHAGVDQFPLLIKFLDAQQALSVQVHPDDLLGAELVGDNGKTEAWVVLAADPGAVIYAGLKPGVGRDDLERAIKNGQVEPLLHRFEPKPGDCVMVEAGVVHALGAGVLLAEVQQTSDATFRVFDWNRVDAQGRPRTLHVQEALRSIDFQRGPVDPIVPVPIMEEGGNVREPLARCDYFELERWTLQSPTELGGDDRFTILLMLDGEVRLPTEEGELTFRKGETVLLPAAIGPTRLAPIDRAVVLTCRQP